MEYKEFKHAVRPESFYKYPLYKARNITTIRDMFDSSTDLFAEKTAFLVKDKHGEPYREVTYADARRDVYALGTAFAALGLKDKKIAVVGENRYEWAITYLAVVCGIGTIVPLDKELPEEELTYLMERAEVSAVVYSDKRRKKFPDLFCENENFIGINMDDDTEDVSIKQIIENLKQESEKTVEEMNSTKLLINEQVVKLNATRDSFVDVSDGINVSRQETAAIEVNVGSCDDARQQVNDVIANLSAISEQNASSAEETTASMQELTATISMLSTTANDLMKISEKLNSEMKFFKI